MLQKRTIDMIKNRRNPLTTIGDKIQFPKMILSDKSANNCREHFMASKTITPRRLNLSLQNQQRQKPAKRESLLKEQNRIKFDVVSINSNYHSTVKPLDSKNVSPFSNRFRLNLENQLTFTSQGSSSHTNRNSIHKSTIQEMESS